MTDESPNSVLIHFNPTALRNDKIVNSFGLLSAIGLTSKYCR